MRTAELQLSLAEYLERFTTLVERYDGTTRHGAELEEIIDDYSRFVTDERNQEVLTRLEQEGAAELHRLVVDLRRQSARCAALMEKYRALKFLDGRVELAEYFHNIEAGIEEEFGSFQLTSASGVLLVGSGSFPMTPLYVARRTGATVVGVDIDAEAVELGRRIVKILGDGLPITLERVPVEDLPFTAEATHIIFSSTVEVKYDLLDRLYPLTREDVVVSMRYGDRLKSLFNYPMREVDQRKWRLVEKVLRPDRVFDIALYVKA